MFDGIDFEQLYSPACDLSPRIHTDKFSMPRLMIAKKWHRKQLKRMAFYERFKAGFYLKCMALDLVY